MGAGKNQVVSAQKEGTGGDLVLGKSERRRPAGAAEKNFAPAFPSPAGCVIIGRII